MISCTIPLARDALVARKGTQLTDSRVQDRAPQTTAQSSTAEVQQLLATSRTA